MPIRMGLLAALGFALFPAMAMACACCADPGTRFEQVAERGDWEISQIARLAPEGPARLFLFTCGMDCVDGITDPRPEYDVDIDVGETAIAFTLSAGGAERGRLTFPWPDSYVWFGADTELTGAGDPALYTEMRFRGAVSGSGDFAAVGSGAAELVLSGHGNMCITTRSFSGWSLTVDTPDAGYRIFGRLQQP